MTDDLSDTHEWDHLKTAYASGAYEEAGVGSKRRLRFDDGTLWFPDGLERVGSHSVALPLLFGVLLVALVATVVALADGSGYWWCFALGLVAVVGVFARVLRATWKADAAALSRLDVGVFLLADRAVLKSGAGGARTIARADISEFRVRHAHRGGGKSNPWVHFIVARDGDPEDVPTDMRANAELLEVLRAWRRGEEASTTDHPP